MSCEEFPWIKLTVSQLKSERECAFTFSLLGKLRY